MVDNERVNRSYVLALAFATSVSMWAAAYLCRLPAIMAPAWLLLLLLLAAVAWWGWYAGRWSGAGWRGGLAVGAAASLLNLLILGSLLSSDEGGGVVPSALWWIPGSMATVAILAAVAALVGASSRAAAARRPDWTALLSRVAAGATFLLVVAGGLVTSKEAGLAAVDWPNPFGYNMFLYPLSRMTGGIYYEHAHRLFGTLVGLTTLALAIHLWCVETRAWVRRLAGAAFVLVVIQGLFGGLRVTGGFTLSTSPEDMAPSVILAAVHGVMGQIFLAVIVVVAVVTSRSWIEAGPAQARPTAASERTLQLALLATLLLQLVLGAVQRHLALGLVVHITLAAVVATIAAVAGLRAWGLYPDTPALQRLGQVLMATVTLQVLLGIAAMAATGGEAVVGDPGVLEVTVATAHQACGAALLAVAVALTAWTRRLVAVGDSLEPVAHS